MIFWLLPWIAIAQDKKPVQPYIDQLKQQMGDNEKPKADVSGSYTEEMKKKLKAQGRSAPSGESYIESLKKSDPQRFGEPSVKPPSFTEQQKSKLGPAQKESAIQALKEGRSDLQLRREGAIHWASGFRLGAAASRTVTGDSASTNGSFGSFYGSGWTPDLNLFVEYQPFHSEWFGNIGIVGGLGFTYNSGNANLKIGNLPNPFGTAGATFGTASHTNLKFITAPVSIGVNYRFNLLRYLRPFVQASPTYIAYLETRSDGRGDIRGKSTGLQIGGGANLLLDNFSKSLSWELYDEFGVKHYYLTVDYTKLSTIAGDVKFDASTLSLGLTYEF